jgi:amino acid adenylation domain-containing protein
VEAVEGARGGEVAVRAGEVGYSYEELNRRANQLAHYLQTLGVGPEVLVAILLDRSLEMVVAILGVLKAGAAYLPLDPQYPQQRLSFMIEDAGVSVLLTEERLARTVNEHDVKRVSLDTEWELIAQQSEQNPVNASTADNLAYVIYTSGSTGQPKGVLITHANVTRLLAATEEHYRFTGADVWTLFHSYAFDFSVWELWGALCYGGTLVVVPYWVSRTPAAFYELLVAERVTVLNQTPSAFRQLIEVDKAIGQAGELALRVVIFGGEALDWQSLQPWVAMHGVERPSLVTMSGITETPVHVTYRHL